MGVIRIPDDMGLKSMGTDCLIYLPQAYHHTEKYPMVLCLHGSGERGQRIQSVRGQGLPHWLDEGNSYPMIVAAPQCREDCFWRSVELIELLDFLEERFTIDEDRIYVLGHSMGGYGAWALAAEAQDRFAAVVPLCGGGDTSSAPKLVNLPIWAYHGEDDTVVPPSESQEMVDAANEAGGRARLTILPGRGHDIRDVAWKNGELIEWMLRRRREAGAQP